MSGIALKLTSLLVRTVAKPFANTLKAQAKEHEFFRKGCIRIAQTVHSTDLRLRMSLLGEKKIIIRPLNDKKAIDMGATFISELFIFSVAGSLIFYESYRSRKKASDQHDALADDISILQGEIEYLKGKLGALNIKLDDYKVPDGVKPKYVKIDKLGGSGSTQTESAGTSSATSPPAASSPTTSAPSAETGATTSSTPPQTPPSAAPA